MAEIFISHASSDSVQAARLAELIRQAGHSVFLDFDRDDGIRPGADWQRALLREIRTCDGLVFLNSPESQASMWCHSELVLAIEHGRRVYPLDVAPGVPLHPLLAHLQRIRMTSVTDPAVQALLRQLDEDAASHGARFRWERGRSPYPGLAAMEPADAAVFFGRDEEVADLLARLTDPLGRQGNLLVVVGPSGAGKSSLVRAGLEPRLMLPGSGWAIAGPIEPGTRPQDNLAASLAALAPTRTQSRRAVPASTERLLSDGLQSLAERLAAQLRATRLLVVIDQAEQLVTLTSPSQAEQFARLLDTGLGQGSPVSVVMTLSSEHFSRFQQLPVLGPAIRTPFAIAPITRTHLAAVIEGPARRADLSFGPGLVTRLLDDTMAGNSPPDGGSAEVANALPFLAFTLREMYDLLLAEDRTTFTDQDYERVGRIRGAILRRAQAAEAALSALPALPAGGDGPALDRLLARFVTVAESGVPAARPVRRDGLSSDERQAVSVLQDQRLLTASGETITLAHDRLITEWPQLATVVADRRDDLRFQARLERQASDWKLGNGALPGREATRAAARWLKERAAPQPGAEPQEDQDIAEYVRAAEGALRGRRMRVTTALVLIVVLAIAAVVVAVAASIQRASALRQSRLAQSEAMASEATNLLDSNPALAMLLSLQAYKRSPTVQAGTALVQAAALPLDKQLSSPFIFCDAISADFRMAAICGDDDVRLVRLGTGRLLHDLHLLPASSADLVDCVAISPDDRYLAVGLTNGTVSVWNTSAGRRLVTMRDPGQVESIAFSPDGSAIAVGSTSGAIRLWAVPAWGPTRSISVGKNEVDALAFSPNGQFLAAEMAGQSSGYAGVWNLSRERPPAFFPAALGASVAFSPDGRDLAYANGDRVEIRNLQNLRPVGFVPYDSGVVSIAYSPDGQKLAVGDVDGQVGLWNLAARRTVEVLPEEGTADDVAFAPDGQELASVGDNDISLWNLSDRDQDATLTSPSPVKTVAFGPGGRMLAGGDDSGDIELWDEASGRRTATLDEGTEVDSIAISPDGSRLATGGQSVDVGIWDLATGHRIMTLDEGSDVTSVAFSSDGQFLAVMDYSSHVDIWNVTSGRRTLAFRYKGPLGVIAFSPDGHALAVGADYVGIWNPATGTRTARFIGSPHAIAFSPDGKTLAIGTANGLVQLLDVATGQRIATLADGNEVNGVAYSPNGRVLVAGDTAGNLRLWNTATDQLFAILGVGNAADPVTSLAFSDRGELAVATAAGDVMLFRQDLAEPDLSYYTNLICTRLHENLTRVEWARYAVGQPYQRTCQQ